MRYLYLDNFRGFNRTVIPINQISFLVGENSTGKSSFLKLISIITNQMFTWDPTLSFDYEMEQGTFDDLVSVSAQDRSYFDVGFLDQSQNDQDQVALYRFRSRSGMPRAESVITAHDGYVAHAVSIVDENAKYRSFKAHALLFAGGPLAIFERLLDMTQQEAPDFKSPKEMGSQTPLAILISLAVPDKLREKFGPMSYRPFANNHVVAIAPIRSAPKQFYGGNRAAYTPDGQHTPYVLRQVLQDTSSSGFVDYLKTFGEVSGLFDAIVVHSFGSDPRSPFELLVKFRNIELSINNVGYGVSQVLPLIVEFITSPHESFFLIQQPEVHLHPRAQAALGALMYSLAKARNYTYFVETHSDFLIDRYRLAMRADDVINTMTSQVIFFKRGDAGNEALPISILGNGRYADDQPKEFRDFFIREEMDLLEI